MRKLLKTAHAEERSVYSNSESNKGNVVNQTCHVIHGGSLKKRGTVPLMLVFTRSHLPDHCTGSCWGS